MTERSEAAAIATDLYQQWANALRDREFEWLERHLAEDYTFSAHPFPDLRLDKSAFIEVDRKMAHADIRFVSVRAERIGTVILSQTIADVTEKFDGDLGNGLGNGLPQAQEANEFFAAKRIAYASAWRLNDSKWQCFDHHMIGPVG